MGCPISDSIRGVVKYSMAGTEARLRHCARARVFFLLSSLSLAHGGLKRKWGRKRGSHQQPAQRVMPLPLWARSGLIWPPSGFGRGHKTYRTNEYCQMSTRPMTSSVSKTYCPYSECLVRRPPGDTSIDRRGRAEGRGRCAFDRLPAVLQQVRAEQAGRLISSSSSVTHSESGVRGPVSSTAILGHASG